MRRKPSEATPKSRLMEIDPNLYRLFEIKVYSATERI